MINSNRGNVSDKILLSGMGFAVIGAIITMGVWWFCNCESTERKIKIIRPIPIPQYREIGAFVEASILELENMPLLELIDLKNKIESFRERGGKNFEIDVSGILDVF